MINLHILKQSTIVHLCFAISYFTSGLILTFIQAILYFGLKPFNKSLYRKINYYLSYSFYSRKYKAFVKFSLLDINTYPLFIDTLFIGFFLYLQNHVLDFLNFELHKMFSCMYLL